MEITLPVDLAPQALSPASLTALTDAAAAVSSSLDLDDVLRTIAGLAREVTRAEASTVFSLDGRRHKLIAVAGTGHRSREAMVGREFDAGLGIPWAGRANRPADQGGGRAAARPASARRSTPIGSLGTHYADCHADAPSGPGDRCDRGCQPARRAGLFGARSEDPPDFPPPWQPRLCKTRRCTRTCGRRFNGLRQSVADHPEIIGESVALGEALRLCGRVAPSNASVLILGETGTGKELTARYIHRLSRRRDATFVALNSAALPETLLESELFGHERGSFTNAHTRKMGRFELADKGTLFLDEIGDISRSTQSKLLRVLQEKEFVRVGGTETIRCDVRIIAATNRNLKNMVADGLFRDDLYYRLSVFPIRMPSLRERREDIPSLVEHFVAPGGARSFTCGVCRSLRRPWICSPGTIGGANIRELQNVIDRAVLMCDGDALAPCHLPPDIQASVPANGSAPTTPRRSTGRSGPLSSRPSRNTVGTRRGPPRNWG